MALRTIVTLPEPVLYRKARAITKFDKNLQTLIDDMIDTMRDAPGVGLAAPQVGISERLIVVEYAEEPAPSNSPQILRIWGRERGGRRRAERSKAQALRHDQS